MIDALYNQMYRTTEIKREECNEVFSDFSCAVFPRNYMDLTGPDNLTCAHKKDVFKFCTDFIEGEDLCR